MQILCFLNIILIDGAKIFLILCHSIVYKNAHFLTPSPALEVLHLPTGLPSTAHPSLFQSGESDGGKLILTFVCVAID